MLPAHHEHGASADSVHELFDYRTLESPVAQATAEEVLGILRNTKTCRESNEML